MAHATEFSSRRKIGLAQRVTSLIAELNARRARRKVYLTTLHELQNLSARELADLGLARSEIRRIAHQAAYEG